MGLLRKAAATTGRGETETAGPPAAPGTLRPKGPGLFKRSIKALKADLAVSGQAAPPAGLAIELAGKQADSGIVPFQVKTPAPVKEAAAPRGDFAPAQEAARRSEDLMEEVLTAVSAVGGGVELPSRLFTVLTTLIGVRKGALLLYDPVRLVYAPWAARGYDQTTLRRMRIPLGANDTWNALANGAPLMLSDAASLSAFQQYFSAREFSSVSRLALAPFIAENKLIAVLLLTDIDSPFSSDGELADCLARAAEAGAPRVHEARAAQITSSGFSGARPEVRVARDEPGQFLSSIGTTSTTVFLLSLSLEDYAKQVLSAHEHLDPFRLHEDLHYFLGSFLADVGRVLAARQARFTVALPDFDPSGVDLFCHQLAMFLHALFSGNGAREDRVLPRILKTISWPADGADLRSLVDSLAT
jgi:hypothetical protein